MGIYVGDSIYKNSANGGGGGGGFDKGIIYFSDFSSFDENAKKDYPIIGSVTDYPITSANLQKGNEDGVSYLFIRSNGTYSQSGSSGINIDISILDIICFELWFKLSNPQQKTEGNLYLYFGNYGYIYDVFFNYLDPGVNGFFCNSDHTKTELSNGAIFSPNYNIGTKFDRTIYDEWVNLAYVIDKTEQKGYGYLNGKLSIQNEQTFPSNFDFFPYPNTNNINCSLTNIKLTKTDMRTADRMNYNYEPFE